MTYLVTVDLYEFLVWECFQVFLMGVLTTTLVIFGEGVLSWVFVCAVLVSMNLELVYWLNLFKTHVTFHFSVEACAMLRGELCCRMVEVSSFAIRLTFSAVGSSENLLISSIAVTIQGNYQHIPSSSPTHHSLGYPWLWWEPAWSLLQYPSIPVVEFCTPWHLILGPHLSSCVLDLCTCVYLPLPLGQLWLPSTLKCFVVP